MRYTKDLIPFADWRNLWLLTNLGSDRKSWDPNCGGPMAMIDFEQTKVTQCSPPFSSFVWMVMECFHHLLPEKVVRAANNHNFPSSLCSSFWSCVNRTRVDFNQIWKQQDRYIYDVRVFVLGSALGKISWGHFQSKNLYCRFWTFIQGFKQGSLEKNCNISFRKWFICIFSSPGTR